MTFLHLMTAPVHSILLMLAGPDTSAQTMQRSQIDRFLLASPRQRRALIDDWQQRIQMPTLA